MKSLLLIAFTMNGAPFKSIGTSNDLDNLVENLTLDLNLYAQRKENFNDRVMIGDFSYLEGHTTAPSSIYDIILVFGLILFSCLIRILEKLSFYCIEIT